MNEDILITIVCVTYNHHEYIRDALDSYLCQQLDFKFEIVVHDDASTDGTGEILSEYEKKYPDKIKVLYESENQYRNVDNFVKCIQEKMIPFIRGKYVLISEGDDYWVDDTKLQRQVEYLEQNADCMMVTHNAVTLNMRSTKVDILTKYYEDRDLTPEEIINHPQGYLATASMVMRRECFELKDFFNEAGIGDYTRQLFCLTKGKIHYIDRIMSVYRFGHSGSWQESQDQDSFLRFYGYLKMIRFLDKYNRYTNYIYNRCLIKEIQRYFNLIMSIWDKENMDKMITKELYNESYQNHLDSLKCLYKQIKNNYYLDDNTVEFMKKYKYILIMGAGKYAAILAEQLKNNGKEFDGFVISPGQDAESLYLGKKIYKLDEIPYKKKETGILIGINAVIWDEVEEALQKYQISNYYCPFLFDVNRKIN